MGDEKLKINDIAIITGVPEDRIKKMVNENPEKFRYREINKVRVFNKNAVDMVLRLTVEDSAGGHSPGNLEKPLPDIGGRKKPPSIPLKKTASVPLDIYTGMKGLHDNAARQKRTIDSLRKEIADKERQIGSLQEELSNEISSLHRLLESQQAQIDSISQWIDYFENLTDEMKLSAAERFIRGWRGDEKR